jgi:hypothetical protein
MNDIISGNSIKIIPIHDEGVWNLYIMFPSKEMSEDVYNQLNEFEVYLKIQSDKILFILINLIDTVSSISFNAALNNAQYPLIKKEVEINNFSTGYFLNDKPIYNRLLPTVVKYQVG